MNKYLAKSNPEQTIQEHTDGLLTNLEKLKSIYPNLQVKWELLRYACIYHDLGKMNVRFQKKIERKGRDAKEIPHGILSLPFINYCFLEDEGYAEDEIKILFQAVAYHHDRSLEFSGDELKKEIAELKKEFVGFEYEPIKDIRFLDDYIEQAFFVVNQRTYEGSEYFLDYVKLKGLLNRLDYAASAEIDVETKNTFLTQGLQNLNYDWNDLQKFMEANRENNVVVVAQTGMGKTEAGLLWIGDNKGFFTLPLKTAINEIYKRITKDIAGEAIKEQVGLLHSDTYGKYIENKAEGEDIDDYYVRTRQLSLPITVCTLDQLFDTVFRYRGFEHKLATLSYAKIVIDEVQMYSDDLLAYLILGLSYITRLGGKFAILTATLPGILVDLLKKERIPFIEASKPFINDTYIRHSLKVENDIISADFIADKFANNKVLVICNTVKKAQEIYKELQENEELKRRCKNINLLHSKFLKMHRKEKEKAIFAFGQKDNQKAGIWVATQIVEASLDIDFDLLITELSDINGLFQRMGRCYRKRKFMSPGYNCYVFDGGERKCSGVGYVIDKKIFEFSKEALKGVDGIITEAKKLTLIEQVYSTEKLEDTEYYNNVIGNIEYVKNISEYELDRQEVSERFRNIDNISIIPYCVYAENETAIKELVQSFQVINEKQEKYKIWQRLSEYTVDVRRNEVKNKKIEKITVSKFQELILCNGFLYDQDIGLESLQDENSDVYSRGKQSSSNII